MASITKKNNYNISTFHPILDKSLSIEFLEKMSSDQHGRLNLYFQLHFSNLGFSDSYAVEIWKMKDFINFWLSKPYKGFYFFQRFKHHAYISLNDSSESLQMLAMQDIYQRAAAWVEQPLFTEEQIAKLQKYVRGKESVPPHLLKPIRNFSIKMDSIAIYQGDYLENYFYTVMDDLIDSEDLKVEFIKRYPVHLLGLNDSTQSYGDYTEFAVYFQNTPTTILRLLVGSPEQILLFPEIYFQVKKQMGQVFFRPARFVITDGTGDLMELVNRLVRNSSEAVPLSLLKYSLGTFFEVNSPQ